MESLLPLKEELDKTNAKIQEMNDNLERWVCEINNNKSMTESEKNEIRLKVFSHFLMSNTFKSLRDFNSEVLWSEISERFFGLENRMEELEKARHAAFGKLESLLGINRDKLLSMTKLEMITFREDCKNTVGLVSAVEEDFVNTFLEQLELLRFVQQMTKGMIEESS